MTIRAAVDRFAKLEQLVSRYTAAAAEWMTADLRASIDRRESPYGVAHAPLAASTVQKKGHDHQLIETHALQDTLQAVQLSATTIGIECAPDYVEHQMATRPPIPRDTVPARWSAELQRILTEQINATLGNS